ncbi:MAG TPA: ATPase, partial [Planctomycetota bacterium]|nr:ATPase [Planctomycetota bacterium]
LPPELLRKGRFDEIFFVDLPNDEERREIFRIHLGLRKRDAAGFNVETLSREAAGFSGAEIEEAIVSALYDAFSEDKPLSTAHIEKALAETVPLSRTMESELARLRAWADGRARLATPREAVAVQQPRRRIEM